MQQTPEQIRNEQRNEGRNRSTLSVRQGYNRGEVKSGGQGMTKKPFVAKGHDLILKNIQDSEGASIRVTLLGDGAEVVGRLVARDKFTITVLTSEGRRRTLYKHAIEGFEPVEPVVQ